jgi:hypothetical protein
MNSAEENNINLIKKRQPIKSFWESRTLFTKRVLAAGGTSRFLGPNGRPGRIILAQASSQVQEKSTPTDKAKYTQKQLQHPPPMILDMGFVIGQKTQSRQPPDNVLLVLRISRDAVYKVSYKDFMISNGSVQAGDNIISIPTINLLEISATRRFTIEIRDAHYHFKYDITIYVNLQDRGPEVDRGLASGPATLNLSLDPSNPVRYNLDMYIKGNLAAKSRKTIHQGLSEGLKKSLKAALESKPWGAWDRIKSSTPGQDEAPRAQMPIPALLMAAYKMLKKKRTPPPPKSSIIQLTFQKSTHSGTIKAVEATLKFKFELKK